MGSIPYRPKGIRTSLRFRPPEVVVKICKNRIRYLERDLEQTKKDIEQIKKYMKRFIDKLNEKGL